jgi:hypothetical protein
MSIETYSKNKIILIFLLMIYKTISQENTYVLFRVTVTNFESNNYYIYHNIPGFSYDWTLGNP